MDPPYQEAPCPHSGPPLSGPDGAGGAECGQEGAAQLDVHVSCRARGYQQWPGHPGCWRSSCSWCPGTPCPGQPAWSWWGSAHSYWWVGFQVCSGPDLPFYKLGTSRRPQLWPFSGCRLPAGDCLNHASVSCQWWFIIIVKYMMFYLQVWPDLKAICTATRNSSIYQWQERICVLAARPLKKMLLLEISESLL